MEMRRSKRKKIAPPRRFLSESAKDSAGQPEFEQPSSHTVAEETAVVYCSDGSDSDSTTGPQSTVTASNCSAAPTAIAALKRRNTDNNALKIRLDAAKDQILSVESERDFLRKQLAKVLALLKKALDEMGSGNSSSSSTSSSSSCSSSSSSASSDRGKKRKRKKNKDSKKKRGKKGKKRNRKNGKNAKRVLTPEEAITVFWRL